jgi:hypothetical protein
MSATVTQRPALEVADVIRQYGDEFLGRYGDMLSAAQHKALRDLSMCRTAALGGHVEQCLDCGAERIAYNSCRNRHCPKCQALARAHWLDQQAKHLLPVRVPSCRVHTAGRAGRADAGEPGRHLRLADA